MRLLLDTHALLWFAEGSERLTPRAKAAIEADENDLFLSVASVWELAIKLALGRLALPGTLPGLLSELLPKTGIQLLDIRVEHLYRLVDLPFHHRDPFDRLLLTQAQHEELSLLSADPVFDAYGADRVW